MKKTGAQIFVESLKMEGVDTLFCYPGGAVLNITDALYESDIKQVLVRHEQAAVHAADGYARMAEKPACTLLHLGPGLANGIANLHNARRAASPIVNIVGDHATYHAQYDAPLASDIEGLARPVSAWYHATTSARNAAADAARAVAAAQQPPGQIATLVLPADTAWLEAEGPATPLRPAPAASVGSKTVDRVKRALGDSTRAAILVRGAALKERGLIAAGRIAAQSGARLWCDTFAPRLQSGAGRVAVERNRRAGKVQCAAIDCRHHFHRVGIGELLRRAADGERRDLNLRPVKELEQWRKKIRRQRRLVALDVDVDVGVDLAGHFPHPIRAAGARRRGHHHGNRARAARLGHFVRIGSHHYGVHQAARLRGAPHPLHHGPAGDGAQHLARHARGLEPRGNDGCNAP